MILYVRDKGIVRDNQLIECKEVLINGETYTVPEYPEWASIEAAYNLEKGFKVSSIMPFGSKFYQPPAIKYTLPDEESPIEMIKQLSLKNDDSVEGENSGKTYYVTQEQLSAIQELKNCSYPISRLYTDAVGETNNALFNPSSSAEIQKAIMLYIGGDDSIQFKPKGPLYRLWLLDGSGNRIYFWIDEENRPDWIGNKDDAFKATLDDIEEWKTPAWSIEKVDE